MIEMTNEEKTTLKNRISEQLQKERVSAVEKNNQQLINEIDQKLARLDEIYQLNEAE